MSKFSQKRLLLLALCFALVPAVILLLLSDAFYSWNIFGEEQLHSFAYMLLFLGGFLGPFLSILFVSRSVLEASYRKALLIGFPCMLLNAIFLYALLLFIPLI